MVVSLPLLKDNVAERELKAFIAGRKLFIHEIENLVESRRIQSACNIFRYAA